MNKDDENSNGSNWVHVDAYTRDDGTHVSEYWRRKNVNGITPWQLSARKDVFLPDLRSPLYDGYNYDLNKMNLGDILQEKAYLGTGRIFKDKYDKSYTTFLNNAINDFEDARNNPNAIVYDSGASIPDAGLRKFITTDNNITDNGKIDVKNMRGAYYNANSDVAYSIAHDSAMKEYINDNYNNLVYNGKKIEEYQNKIPTEMQPWFKSTYVDKGNVELSDWSNKWDIAHCTLYNPHIDRNGNFKAQMIDIVDYENRKLPNKYSAGYIPNQWGYKMQQIGRIENVFHVVDIDIPLSDIYGEYHN